MKHLKIQEGQNIAVIWEQAEDGEYTRRVAECQRLTNYDGNAHNEAAKQIVLACNCHDDLLEACRALLADLSTATTPIAGSNGRYEKSREYIAHVLSHRLSACCTAIAKATKTE
jgi:hypothetical protein